MPNSLIEEFDIRTPSRDDTTAGALSGGNQQKVIVAREFSRPIKLLVASQPTRGLDVGSIEYIHGRIVEKRDEGCAVLLVSPELDEIMELSDRIAVMYRGKIVAIVAADAGHQGVRWAADGRRQPGAGAASRIAAGDTDRESRSSEAATLTEEDETQD